MVQSSGLKLGFPTGRVFFRKKTGWPNFRFFFPLVHVLKIEDEIKANINKKSIFVIDIILSRYYINTIEIIY